MVTLELNFIGKVKIQDSQVINGPEYLKPTVNILMQKYDNNSMEDPDYMVAKNLVEMMGGRILENAPREQ